MKSLHRLFHLLGMCVAFFLLSLSAYGQGGDVGSIIGQITDKSGGALAGATVSVIDTQRGVTRTLTTDDNGSYFAPNLTPGTYTVRAEYTGFQTLERRNILVQVTQQLRIDLSLQPGEQTQTITVTEEAPLVETTNATLGGVLSNELISDLPLNGRNFNRLLDLQPGFYVQPGSGKWGQQSNGMRAEHNIYILNGIDTVEGFSSQSVLNATPVFGDTTTVLPIDAIQEFKTEQNPSAEFGWKPGAIVNVGLKSGTNSFHGTANAFGRADFLDATNPFINFANAANLAKGSNVLSAKQQTAIETFGATLGGPIVRNRLFFFIGYEGQRNHISAPSASGSLPTVDPLTSSTPLNKVTWSALDACNQLTTAPSPLSLKLAGLTYGGPGNCAVTSPYTGIFITAPTEGIDLVTPIGDSTSNNGLAKVDYHLNEKNTLSGEFFIGNWDGLGFQGSPLQPYWDIRSHAKAMIIGTHWTWLPKSSVVNEAHFGVNRFYQPSYPGDCGSIGQPSGEQGINWGTQSTIIPQTGLSGNCGMPTISISGFTNNGIGCCSSFPKMQGPDYTIQVDEALSYLHGAHSFKFGGEARRMSTFEGTFQGSRGNIVFPPTTTTGCTSIPIPTTCVTGLMKFMLGTTSSTTLPSELVGTPNVHVSNHGYALFAQDDWRIRRSLTLNLGVRFERVSPLQEAHNQLANFDPSTPTGLTQLGLTKNIFPAWNNFAPRIGFAWDITGNSKWVLRGGFNMIYVLEGFNDFISQQNTNPITTGLNTIPSGATLHTCVLAGTTCTDTPVAGPGNMQTVILPFQSINWAAWNSATNPAVFPSVTSIVCGDPRLAAPNSTPCAIMAVDPNLKRAYVPGWSIGIQHAFTNSLSLQVVYVGNHGVRLLGLNDANPPAPGSGWEAYSSTNKTCSPGGAPGGSISQTCQNLSRKYFSKFPYLSQINEMQNLDASKYNSLQVTLTQRAWHRLNYVLGYVYGHCFEMMSRAGAAGGSWLPGNIYNVAADYGNCDFDVRHNVTLSLTYALPGKKGYGQMLEGWKINSVFRYQTAIPWRVEDTKDNISGTNSLRDHWDFFGNINDFNNQQYAGIAYYTGTANTGTNSAQFNQCLTQAIALDSGYTPVFSGWTVANSGHEAALLKFGCFVNGSSVQIPPAYGTWGNEGRNMFRGEPFHTWDLSLAKAFRFTERVNAEFRFESFNILNQTNYYTNTGDPSATSTFGASRQTPDVGISNATVGSGGPRSIQLGFRLTF
ncbi:MAG: TonB-dependent receptor [Acidobacteriia bacterium]|nr:TonB-dependent receptor [Terriglobia bacterium]